MTAARVHRPSPSDSSTRRGRAGEEEAAAWLAESGWLIRGRNFRATRGEIDIIATRDDTIAFFEVKSWSALPASELEHSIDRRKRLRIAHAAQVFLLRNPSFRGLRPRFDVLFLGTREPRVRHIADAFTGEVD
jgi:putative endonuclease